VKRSQRRNYGNNRNKATGGHETRSRLGEEGDGLTSWRPQGFSLTLSYGDAVSDAGERNRKAAHAARVQNSRHETGGGKCPIIFDRVIVLNLVANTVVFYVAARLYLLPLVSRLRPQQILVPILLPHSTRHLGMMFLTPGATYPGLPPQFA
jgi:hypothetical protein